MNKILKFIDENKEKLLIKTKVYAKKNHYNLYLALIKKLYKLDKTQYEAMVLEQDSKCKICKLPPTKQRLCVDHCHKTGKVRGLLCNNCNFLIGHANEQIDILNSAIGYLKND